VADVTRSITFTLATRVRGYGTYSAGETARFDVATATDLVNRGMATWRGTADVAVPTLEEFTTADIADLEPIVEALKD
jgi:hypothetical protein